MRQSIDKEQLHPQLRQALEADAQKLGVSLDSYLSMLENPTRENQAQLKKLEGRGRKIWVYPPEPRIRRIMRVMRNVLPGGR